MLYDIVVLMCLFCFFFVLLIRLPPRSTRTDTLFPYTTLFRSLCPLRGGLASCPVQSRPGRAPLASDRSPAPQYRYIRGIGFRPAPECRGACNQHILSCCHGSRRCAGVNTTVYFQADILACLVDHLAHGSTKERRVGKECVSTCRAWWWPSL